MKQNMKVAISCHSFRLDGGMGRYVLLLTKGLLNLGYEPYIVSKKFDTTLAEYRLINHILISTKLIPQKFVDAYFDFRLGRVVDREKFDLVLSCNRNTHSNIPMCGGTHIGYLQKMEKRVGFFDKKQIALEKKYYENSDMVVAHSDHIRSELINLYGVDNRKIFLAYPPFSVENFSYTSESERRLLREKFGFPNDRVVFVLPSAGNHFVKGLDLIADFFRKTKLPVLLAVAGRPIPAEYKHVKYLGFQKDMKSVYQAADFTILPSRYEAFGQVGPESVACGTPVVFSNVVGSSEVIDPQAKIEFNWQIDGDIDRAIGEAVTKVQNHQARIINGKSFIHCQTDINSHVQSILKAWERIQKS